MGAKAAPLLIPDAVTRVLALHGPSQLGAGRLSWRLSVPAHVAPFDDQLILMVSPGSPIFKTLLRDPRADVAAASPEAAYNLRLYGRAVDTGGAGAHPRRMELAAWLPDGGVLHRFRAIEFVPERIEFSEGREDERRYFEGATSAAKVPTVALRWLQACFGGIWPSVVVAVAGLWAWVGWYGQWYTMRLVALAVVLTAALCAMASARLVFRVLAFSAWQRGQLDRDLSGPLGEGLLPVRGCSLAGVVLAVVSLVAVVISGAAWEPGLLASALVGTQLWYLVPAWAWKLAGGKTRAPGKEA